MVQNVKNFRIFLGGYILGVIGAGASAASSAFEDISHPY